MPRTVVHSSRERGVDGSVKGDSLPEKLVKYVPAEVLAFFVPLAAVIGDKRDGLLLLVSVTAVVGTPLYLLASARKLPQKQRPHPYFYALACIATIGWLVGTSANTAKLIGLDNVAGAVILGLTVFILPVVDDLVDRR